MRSRDFPSPPAEEKVVAERPDEEAMGDSASPVSANPVVQRARLGRRRLTSAEARLWSLLRDRRLRYKFRRQHSIGKFVVDFACPTIRLIIEVDGWSHEAEAQRAFDAERDDYLTARGGEPSAFRMRMCVNPSAKLRRRYVAFWNRERYLLIRPFGPPSPPQEE